VDSGAAIARRTAWLLEHEAPDAKSTDENVAFCMAMTTEAEQLLPCYSAMALKRSKNCQFKWF
jgi:glutamate racemase